MGRKAFRLLVSLLLTHLVTAPAVAKPCDNVRFINGINTADRRATRDQAADLANEAILAAQQAGLTPCWTFSYDYNKNELLFLDLFEAAKQVIQNESARFWRLLGGTDRDDGFANIFQVFASQTDALATVIDSDLSAMEQRYRELLGYERIVVVAHSQGNYYANQLYNLLVRSALPVAHPDWLQLVAVATPASTVEGAPERYTTLTRDFIWQVPFALLPNADNGECGNPFACHLFNTSYLAGQNSRSRILEHLLSVVTPTSLPPTAAFTVTGGGQTVSDGQTLRLTSPSGTNVEITMDATATQSSGTSIVAYNWLIDGVPLGNQRQVVAVVGHGRHEITLVVEDERGGRSAAATAIVRINRPGVNAEFTMSSGGASVEDGGDLRVHALPGNTISVTFDDRSFPASEIASREWRLGTSGEALATGASFARGFAVGIYKVTLTVRTYAGDVIMTSGVIDVRLQGEELFAGVMKTTDGGASWVRVPNSPSAISDRSLAVDFANPQMLYLGTGQGSYRSLDGGVTWTHPQLGYVGSLFEVVADRTTSARAYGFTFQQVFMTTDGGVSWGLSGILPSSFLDSSAKLALHPLDGRVLAVGASDGSIYKSVDGGNTWTFVMNLPRNINGPRFGGIAIRPSDGAIVAGPDAVAISATDGTTYTAGRFGVRRNNVYVNAGLQGILGEASTAEIVVSDVTPNVVYVAFTDATGGASWLFRSVNGGQEWTELRIKTFSRTSVRSLAVDPVDPNVAYISVIEHYPF